MILSNAEFNCEFEFEFNGSFVHFQSKHVSYHQVSFLGILYGKCIEQKNTFYWYVLEIFEKNVTGKINCIHISDALKRPK